MGECERRRVFPSTVQLHKIIFDFQGCDDDARNYEQINLISLA